MPKWNQDPVIFFKKTGENNQHQVAGEFFTPIIPANCSLQVRSLHQNVLVNKLQTEIDIPISLANELANELERQHQKRQPKKTVRYGIKLTATDNSENSILPFVESDHDQKEIRADIANWAKTIIPRNTKTTSSSPTSPTN